MKTEESEKFIRWCVLGAIGGIFMAAGDWLLGCVPLQETDAGMFKRAYYLSGAYGLWRPVLIVGLGAIGSFLYFFLMVKALNADIGPQYSKTTFVHSLCGIFTVAVALAVTAYQDDMLIAILPMYIPMVLLFGIHFVMLLAGKTRYPR